MKISIWVYVTLLIFAFGYGLTQHLGYRIEQEVYNGSFGPTFKTWVRYNSKIIKAYSCPINEITDQTKARQLAQAKEFIARLKGEKFTGIVHDTICVTDTIFIPPNAEQPDLKYKNLTETRNIKFDSKINIDGTVDLYWTIWFDGFIIKGGHEYNLKPTLIGIKKLRLKAMADKLIGLYLETLRQSEASNILNTFFIKVAYKPLTTKPTSIPP